MHILEYLERLKKKKTNRIFSAVISIERQKCCTEVTLLNEESLEFTFPCTQPVSSTGRKVVRSKSITVKIKTHGAIKESKLKIRSNIMKIPVNLMATCFESRVLFEKMEASITFPNNTDKLT